MTKYAIEKNTLALDYVNFGGKSLRNVGLSLLLFSRIINKVYHYFINAI